MTTTTRIFFLILLGIFMSGCASKPLIKEGPHKGWSESLAIEDETTRQSNESEYQNALQRLD